MLLSNKTTRIKNVQHFNVFIDDKNINTFIESLTSYIRPNWKTESVKTKVFDGGTSNKLIGLYTQTMDQFTDISAEADAILVRIYGNKTDTIIDREQELWNFSELSTNGIAPKLFCTFNNGYSYQYISGDVITPVALKDDGMLQFTARLVAKLHCTKLSPAYLKRYPMKGTVFQTLKGYLGELPRAYEDREKQKRFLETNISMDHIKDEVKHMEAILLELPNKEIAFCHNDLNCPNLIYNNETEQVFCIDYEYACPNYVGYDIGNFFNEFPGNTDIDFSLYPNKETQLYWLKVYLEEKRSLLEGTGTSYEVNDNSVLKLYVEVNQFALVSHLLWGVWALIQAHNSVIDFDFIGYSVTRFDEYFRRKEEFLNLDKQVSNK